MNIQKRQSLPCRQTKNKNMKTVIYSFRPPQGAGCYLSVKRMLDLRSLSRMYSS